MIVPTMKEMPLMRPMVRGTSTCSSLVTSSTHFPFAAAVSDVAVAGPGWVDRVLFSRAHRHVPACSETLRDVRHFYRPRASSRSDAIVIFEPDFVLFAQKMSPQGSGVNDSSLGQWLGALLGSADQRNGCVNRIWSVLSSGISTDLPSTSSHSIWLTSHW